MRYQPPRPRRKAGAGGLVLLGLLALLLVGAFAAARGVLNRKPPAAVPSQSALPSGTVVNVAVQPGETSAEIARDLQEKGLVPNDAVFLGVRKLRHGGTNFQPGIHQLRAGASMDDIVDELQKPVPPQEIRITLPEGRRLEEAAELAARAGLGTAASFTQLATHPDPGW